MRFVERFWLSIREGFPLVMAGPVFGAAADTLWAISGERGAATEHLGISDKCGTATARREVAGECGTDSDSFG